MTYNVFFDLDETLLECKSMFEVMAYFYMKKENKGLGVSQFNKFKAKVDAYALLNTNEREKINIFFYQQLEGVNVSFMQHCCEEWFNETGRYLLRDSIVAELQKHQKQQATIYIVSGSFYQCVKPIADCLNVKNIICTNLVADNNIFTGEITTRPVIGVGKADLIMEIIKKNQLNFKGSYAYADHISDLNMLLLAENPVVVGNDRELLNIAKNKCWIVMN